MAKKRKVEVDDEDLNSDTTKPTENVHVKEEENSSSSSSSKEDRLTKLLEPFTKQHLIQILVTAAFNTPKILKEIHQVADLNYAHRKLFVHGLNLETTTQIRLQLFFSQYGEIEDSLIVFDKETRRSKGFGFVVFKNRGSAEKALKDRPKMLDNRFIYCNLASDDSSCYSSQQADLFERKIYVGNVHKEIPAYKLFDFFSKYGEIEKGPLGFDITTGKARGFALFIYKTAEGARKALKEPMKSLNGFPLMYCDRVKASSSSSPPPPPGLHEAGGVHNYGFHSMGSFGCGSSGVGVGAAGFCVGGGGFRGCSGCGRGGGCHGIGNVGGGGSNTAAPMPATVPVGGGGGGDDLQGFDSLITMFLFHLFFILFCFLVLIFLSKNATE